jgi:hypothetical protein
MNAYNYVIARNHQSGWKNGNDVLILEPNNSHVIASAARQSHTVQSGPAQYAIASCLAMT